MPVPLHAIRLSADRTFAIASGGSLSSKSQKHVNTASVSLGCEIHGTQHVFVSRILHLFLSLLLHFRMWLYMCLDQWVSGNRSTPYVQIF